MKKILFAAFAVIAIGFVSCGNKAQSDETVDSVSVDSVDSVAVDSIVAE